MTNLKPVSEVIVDIDLAADRLPTDVGAASVTATGAVTSTGLINASGAITVTNGQLGDGGAHVAVVAGAKATDTAISAVAGRLARVIVTVVGTHPPVFVDGSSSFAFIPASAAVGSIYEVQIPIGTGITLTGNATNPGLIVTYD